MPGTHTYTDEDTPTGEPDRLLTVGEAADYLGFSANTLRRWDVAGKLVAGRTPAGQRRYRLSDLDDVLAEIRGAA